MKVKRQSRFSPILLFISLIIGILIGTFLAGRFSGNRLNIINSSSNKINDLLHIIDNQYVDTVNISNIVEDAMPKIIEELEGEKIDIIQYSENDEEFIAAALSPAQVISVTINDPEPDEKTGEMKNKCTVIVPNNQLSLAIGNRGQNAKLAAKLTKYTIDIKPENEIPE